jgi:hypothetical protein
MTNTIDETSLLTGFFESPEHGFYSNPDQANEKMKFCNSYNRLPTLLDLAYRMEDCDWLNLLGNEWSGCDNISRFYKALLDTPLGDDELTCFDMMTDEEREAFVCLPDLVTVYRGCYKLNKWGLSWTLSETIAKEFPSLNRYRRDEDSPIIVKAVVKKENIKAIKLDREEQEVIVWRPKHVSTKYIRQT